jgi:hypothetical protein
MSWYRVLEDREDKEANEFEALAYDCRSVGIAMLVAFAVLCALAVALIAVFPTSRTCTAPSTA